MKILQFWRIFIVIRLRQYTHTAPCGRTLKPPKRRTYGQQVERKNTFVNYTTDERSISEIKKKFKKLNRNKAVWLRIGQRTWTGICESIRYRWSTDIWKMHLPATREIKIKITMGFHLTWEWLSSKNQKMKNAGEAMAGDTPIHCWWVYKLIQLYRFLRDLKTGLLYDPAILLLEIYPKKMESAYDLSIPPCLTQLNSQQLRYGIT